MEDWTLHMINTGADTNTGGRVKRLESELQGQTFLLTYGDGVSNLDLNSLLEFHKRCGRLATVTAVRPPARFGGLIFDGDLVAKFSEKPQIGEGWINGGFLVLEPGIFKYLANDGTSLEADAARFTLKHHPCHASFLRHVHSEFAVRLLARASNSGNSLRAAVALIPKRLSTSRRIACTINKSCPPSPPSKSSAFRKHA